MSVLFVLLPVVLVVVLGAVIAWLWAVKRGQFDDLESPALRVLNDDEPAPPGDRRAEESGADRPGS